MGCVGFAQQATSQITIQTPTATVTELGGRDVTFSTLATVWAILTPKSPREIIASGGLAVRVTHEAVIRYRSDMANPANTGALRVSMGDRVFGVRGSVPVGDDMKKDGRTYIKVMLEENGGDVNG